MLQKSLNPGSQTTFLIAQIINIVQFGGFFTTGDTQKIKESLGTSRVIFVKNPVGILVSGPNKCRKWVALIGNKNNLGSIIQGHECNEKWRRLSRSLEYNTYILAIM